MRNLHKRSVPAILEREAEAWAREFAENPDSTTARFRYRHPDIKHALRAETGEKCIYCESKIGHNTPGDIEHKIPTSADRTHHFEWGNLTLACTECNRRKGTYHDPHLPFLDPYHDDVEAVLVHHGPIVGWRAGEERAEVTVRRLELNSMTRTPLIARKVEKLEEVHQLVGRLSKPLPAALREALLLRLAEMRLIDAEYSAMVIAVCGGAGGAQDEAAAIPVRPNSG